MALHMSQKTHHCCVNGVVELNLQNSTPFSLLGMMKTINLPLIFAGAVAAHSAVSKIKFDGTTYFSFGHLFIKANSFELSSPRCTLR
jgi:hypothetical protein